MSGLTEGGWNEGLVSWSGAGGRRDGPWRTKFRIKLCTNGPISVGYAPGYCFRRRSLLSLLQPAALRTALLFARMGGLPRDGITHRSLYTDGSHHVLTVADSWGRSAVQSPAQGYQKRLPRPPLSWSPSRRWSQKSQQSHLSPLLWRRPLGYRHTFTLGTMLP
jgi:hypothetical protein